eukprot:CAMPEP_0194580202 /NCGR_PEP_ID=MMETSP0292-20121207/14045_1 /TAXON_ID=39354 /ORGANISM="Heterosigma akashiwo, Strain CCMP2393" /LENGTH=41 /DNA_ID= /DNA_START= /DNA_END= /DNA_ORIENTATION=
MASFSSSFMPSEFNIALQTMIVCIEDPEFIQIPPFIPIATS